MKFLFKAFKTNILINIAQMVAAIGVFILLTVDGDNKVFGMACFLIGFVIGLLGFDLMEDGE